MSFDIEHDAGLARLRRDHLSERVPAELRERVIERLHAPEMRPCETRASSQQGRAAGAALFRRRLGMGMAAAASLGAVWLWLSSSEPEREFLGRLGPEPSEGDTRARAGQSRPPPLDALAGPARARPCPIDELLGGLIPDDVLRDTPPPPPEAARLGLTWHTVTLSTPRCGQLPRHYLQLVPPGTPPVYRGRVVILLPGEGSPESYAIETRWYFDALARERQAITVYAKALKEPRASAPATIVGGWQTDDGAHPEVDDEEYLDDIVLDLARRGVIGGGNEVWLVGKGSGAVMALSAAAHHPERYTGVAAFMPTRFDVLPAAGLSGPRMARRLQRMLLVIDGRPEDVLGGELEVRSKQWALALGVQGQRAPDARVELSPRGTGVRQIDIGSGARGAPGVRILTFERGTDPFPPPGGADALSLAASRQKPGANNGAEEVWRFLGDE